MLWSVLIETGFAKFNQAIAGLNQKDEASHSVKILIKNLEAAIKSLYKSLRNDSDKDIGAVLQTLTKAQLKIHIRNFRRYQEDAVELFGDNVIVLFNNSFQELNQVLPRVMTLLQNRLNQLEAPLVQEEKIPANNQLEIEPMVVTLDEPRAPVALGQPDQEELPELAVDPALNLNLSRMSNAGFLHNIAVRQPQPQPVPVQPINAVAPQLDEYKHMLYDPEFYTLDLMLANTDLQPGKIYLRKINDFLVYTLTTPAGEIRRDIPLPIRVPEALTLDILNTTYKNHIFDAIESTGSTIDASLVNPTIIPLELSKFKAKLLYGLFIKLIPKSDVMNFVLLDHLPEDQEFKQMTILTQNPPSIRQFDQVGNESIILDQQDVTHFFESINCLNLLTDRSLVANPANFWHILGHENFQKLDTLIGVRGGKNLIPDVLATNKVVLLEWQTNRPRKLKGKRSISFSTANGKFSLSEKEPVRVILDKTPIPLMEYETQFVPTKKRLLQVPHAIIDNRRKYEIRIPNNMWAVYELYEMHGPNIHQDIGNLLFRSPFAPPLDIAPSSETYLQPRVLNLADYNEAEVKNDNIPDDVSENSITSASAFNPALLLNRRRPSQTSASISAYPASPNLRNLGRLTQEPDNFDEPTAFLSMSSANNAQAASAAPTAFASMSSSGSAFAEPTAFASMSSMNNAQTASAAPTAFTSMSSSGSAFVEPTAFATMSGSGSVFEEKLPSVSVASTGMIVNKLIPNANLSDTAQSIAAILTAVHVETKVEVRLGFNTLNKMGLNGQASKTFLDTINPETVKSPIEKLSEFFNKHSDVSTEVKGQGHRDKDLRRNQQVRYILEFNKVGLAVGINKDGDKDKAREHAARQALTMLKLAYADLNSAQLNILNIEHPLKSTTAAKVTPQSFTKEDGNYSPTLQLVRR